MREKIAFYGLTEQEEAYLKYAQTAEIVCFIKPPETAYDSGLLHGVPVRELTVPQTDAAMPSTAVVQMDADYPSARDALVRAGFDEDRIIHESNYFSFRSPLLQLESMTEDCRSLRISCLTDLGLSLCARNVFSFPDDFPVYGCLTAGQDAEILLPVQDNLYSGVWGALEELPLRVRREALYLGPMYEAFEMEEAMERIVSLALQCKAVYLSVPFPDTVRNRKWYLFREMKNLSVTELTAGAERFFRITKKPASAMTSVYVAVHKEAALPGSATYVPLWLGKEEENTKGYVTHQTEPSVAYLNPRINECTGLYWMWKHSDAEILGLVHYRRYFYSMRNDVPEATLIESDEIQEYLSDYDILLPKLNAFVLPLHVQIGTGLDRDVCARGMEVFRKCIAEKQPEYLPFFERVMEGHCFYPLNMMITRRELFHRYCEWLFSFLIDAATELDMDSHTDNNRRIAGFFAERMLTVWLTRQELRIKELPVGKII